jgi:rare lipoprotein A (peptidoglycan hydrolase)
MALVHRTRFLPAFVAASVLLPAAALAQDGTGGSVAPEPTPPASSTLTVGPPALLGRPGKVSGTVKRRYHGRVVRVQRYDDARREWQSEARAVIARDGSFKATWKPTALGQVRLRAALQSRRSATVTSASPEVVVQVFRAGMATWYGPGLYGNKTACGQELTPDLVGVAHRTLPCGTMVRIAYGDTSVVVPVIDRGPYADGISWDLTAATAKMLGMTSTSRVGALVQP